MSERIVAEAAIEVGHHIQQKWFGMTVNVDTVMATAITAVIVIGLAFFLRAKVTSTGVPGGVQLFFEAITIQMRQQIAPERVRAGSVFDTGLTGRQHPRGQSHWLCATQAHELPRLENSDQQPLR